MHSHSLGTQAGAAMDDHQVPKTSITKIYVNTVPTGIPLLLTILTAVESESKRKNGK